MCPICLINRQLVDMGFDLKRASKALVETQNKSLAAALDYMEVNPWDPATEVQEATANEAMQVVQPSEMVSKPAPTPVPATTKPEPAPLKTRYDLSGRDSFEERQRLKEAERMKKEKAEREAAKERAKREAELERLERMKRAGIDPSQAAVCVICLNRLQHG